MSGSHAQHIPMSVSDGLRQLLFASLLLAAALPLVAHVSLGVGFAPVLSSSMEPAVAAGSLEVWRPKPAASLSVGDIVILRDETSYTEYSHRIVRLSESEQGIVLLTKGDANPAADSKATVVPKLATVPVVQAAVPKVGSFFAVATSRTAMRVAWAVLVGALILYAASAALNARKKGMS